MYKYHNNHLSIVELIMAATKEPVKKSAGSLANPTSYLIQLVTWSHSGNYSPNKIVLVSDILVFKWLKVNREIIIFGKIKVERECQNGTVSRKGLRLKKRWGVGWLRF